MKKFGLLFLIVFMLSVPVQAQTVKIPDVIGLEEDEAVRLLEEVNLPDAGKIQVIKEYRYSSGEEADIVYEQFPIGEVDVTEAGNVNITISMGTEPSDLLSLSNESVSNMSTFGLARYLDTDTDNTESQFGINWDSLPCSYEYNWDNSDMCWKYGVWIDGVCYKTPEGEFSTDVRHKVQVYCDGISVYTRIVFSRDFWSTANGDNYRYIFDGEEAVFQLTGPKGQSLTNESKKMEVGISQVNVLHSRGSMSSQNVNGSMAYLTKFDSGINAVLEIKIPLSEIMNQNSDIDMETVGTMQFQSSNIMYRTTTISGADTLPFASAGFLLILIPVNAFILTKYHQKRNGNGQKV